MLDRSIQTPNKRTIAHPVLQGQGSEVRWLRCVWRQRRILQRGVDRPKVRLAIAGVRRVVLPIIPVARGFESSEQDTALQHGDAPDEKRGLDKRAREEHAREVFAYIHNWISRVALEYATVTRRGNERTLVHPRNNGILTRVAACRRRGRVAPLGGEDG